ncbi:hypothetical protein DKX38_012516 [Salix brachista]|uniref:Autophagy-related protein n=1 Tax=Salix brachista TaxID=2182728 RepID=A0A5N5LNN0_9ROSI|nr:hypothetical protein DKX38_012516 [Salix brachista]
MKITISFFNSLRYYFLIIAILHRAGSLNPVSAVCERSFVVGNKVYSFSLVSPLPNFPHGVLSEDGYCCITYLCVEIARYNDKIDKASRRQYCGDAFRKRENTRNDWIRRFYKVAVNKTVLWFQLCDGMIFNHDPPRCVDCLDCGGASHCGMECSALMAKNIGGYDVCTTIGKVTSTTTNIIDNQNPHKGVIVKMTSSGSEHNCSLSVSVICDSNGVLGPHSLEKLGTCDYTRPRIMKPLSLHLAAVLQHPSGCATINGHGKGWGWFGTLMIIVLCLFGGYLSAGAVYRHFFLGFHGLDMIPNLDFWTRLPHRTQSFFASLVRKFRGPTEGHRNSYSPVNF